MNSKITFPELVELVAGKASTSKRVSELFLKELVAIVSQALTEGESVKIKGLGTFKLTRVGARKSIDVNTGEEIEIPGHHKLAFVPEKKLANAINQPFAQFETEVLSDEVTDEQLAGIDEEPLDLLEEEVIAQAVTVANDEEDTPAEPATPQVAPLTVANAIDDEAQADVQDAIDEVMNEQPPTFVPPVEPEPELEPTTETPHAFTPQEQEAAIESPEEPARCEEVGSSDMCDPHEAITDESEKVESEISKRKHGHRMFLEGFMIGVVTSLIVAWVSYKLYMMKYAPKIATTELVAHKASKPRTSSVAKVVTDTATKPVVEAQKPATVKDTVEKASVAQQSAKRATTVVKDTINAQSTLTRIARRHYGNNFFWVYIYEENKAKIKDPDNIPIGTVVVVPPAEKYGIDKNDPASVAKAKNKLREIYNRNAKRGK